MQFQPREQVGDTIDGHWTHTFEDLSTDHGSEPSAVVPGVFSVACGVDGRSEGYIRRSAGMVLWADLCSGSFAVNGLYGANVLTDPFRGFHEVRPFTLRKRNSNGYVYGFLLFALTVNAPATRPVWVVWKDSDTNDLNDPRSVESGGNGWNWEPYQLSTEGLQSQTIENYLKLPPLLTYSGRVAYVMQPHGRTSQNDPPGHGVFWWDSSVGPVAGGGWHFDGMGIPPRDRLSCTAPNINTGNGLMLAGRYRFASRLIDSFRRRYSNMAWNLPTYVGSQPSMAAEVSVADDDFALVDLNTAGPVTAQSSSADRRTWDRYQTFSTFSSQDIATPGGGDFTLLDEMPLHPSFINGGATPATTRARVYPDTDRAETFAVFDGDGTLRQSQPMTDRALASNAIVYNPTADDCLDWNEMNGIFGAAFYKGLHVCVASLRAKKSDGTLAESSGLLDIVWSDTRTFAPENFPVGNRFTTQYSEQRPAPVTSPTVQLDQMRFRPAIAMVECSGSLYIFGGGPVYRVQRREDGSVNVETVSDGVKIISRDSVASYGQGAVVVTDSGVFLLDGSTGSMSPVRGLDRLIRDRWIWPGAQHNVQCAYDSIMDAVYILNPDSAELVTMWLATNRITMDANANFSFLREMFLPTVAGGPLSKRALFMTWFGKICYPDNKHTPIERGRYTMHGLRSYGGKLTLPSEFNPRVRMVEQVTVSGTPLAGQPWPPLGGRMARIHLEDSNGVPISMSKMIASGITITFLSGIAVGRSYQTYYQSSVAPGLVDYVDVPWGEYTGSAIFLDSSLVGSRVALSTVRFLMIGGSLPGTSLKRHLQRKHVHAMLPVLSRTDSEFNLAQQHVGVMVVGTCNPSHLLDSEGDGNSPIPSRPRFDQLPDWISRDTFLTLGETPKAGTSYDVDKPYTNYVYLNAPFGTAGAIILPVLACNASAAGFRLLEWYVDGQISTSEKPN